MHVSVCACEGEYDYISLTECSVLSAVIRLTSGNVTSRIKCCV